MICGVRSTVLILGLTAALMEATVGCHRLEDLSSVPGIGDLERRCVQLRRPMVIVESAEGKYIDGYLVPGDELTSMGENGRQYIGRVDQGARFRIDRVFLESSFEDQRVTILGHHIGRYEDKDVDLFHVLSGDWLFDAWKWATRESHPEAVQPDPLRALDRGWAEWCE